MSAWPPFPHLPLVAFVGHSGSGKTTLLEQVIAELRGRGVSVGAVKHDPKGHAAYDHPGKDSWRYREAGASIVALAGPTAVATFQRLEDEIPLYALAAQIAGQATIDLVLAEGFHTFPHVAKIEVFRPAVARLPLCTTADVIAVATDSEKRVTRLEHVPHLSINDPSAVASFLVELVHAHSQHAHSRNGRHLRR
jgi:molybdopterin-guanine dinucleotide biosynthesis protein MobB